MKRIGVVITDGVGYRNFVLSDFILEAQKEFNRVIVFSCLPKQVYESLDLKCEIVELDVFEETFKIWFFRKAKELAHLQLHKKGNFGITDNLKANFSKAKNPRGIATRFLFHITHNLHSESWIQRFNKLQQSTFKTHFITQKYISLLKEYGVNLLFFTHQRPPYIAPLIYAAEKLRIQTISFIFSWDNLASKGRMSGNFDFYLVWSEQMKQELLQFYTSIKENQVEVVGTPQFEPYVLDRYDMPRNVFLERFGLDATKPTVLFSCGDVSTSPNDPLYIELIAKMIQENRLVKPVNLLVRTSPAEEPKRFAELAAKYPFICWNYPDWKLARSNHQESWSQRIPSVQDVTDLKAVLQYSDLCVNMLSTMSLDSMLFNKPVINTVFGNPENGLANDQRFLRYAHIVNVINSNAVSVAKTENELLLALNQCLQQPDYKLQEQRTLLKMQIGYELKGTSERIALALKKML